MPIGGGMNKRDMGSAVQGFARFGYAAKGVVYMLIATLALGAAAGSGSAGNSREAMGTLRDKPFGKIVLAIIAIGLVGYAVWRFYSALANPERDKPFTRLGYFGTGLFNAALAAAAGRMAFAGSGSGGDRSQEWTSQIMSHDLGIPVIIASGAGILGYGLWQLTRAFRSKLDSQLRLGEIDHKARNWVIRLARLGIAARGIVFSIVGGLLIKAALEHDPSEARDFGGGLDTLQQQPYGKWLLGAVALGLFLYGLYNVLRARYRVIQT